jgi:NADH dehydrogenase
VHELLRFAGADIVTVREVLELFEKVTDRAPLHLPLPSFVARIGTSLADALGVRGPVSAATVQMLLEGSYLRDGERNDLTERFGRAMSPIRDRLVQLVDTQPEQTPDNGVGRLRRRRFTVDIIETPFSALELLERFRRQFARLVPFEAAAEPGSSARLEDGSTLTLGLSLRGHAQMRVERIDDNTITMATVAGHPLAGVVRFGFRSRDDGIRFTIDVIARPATRADQISMAVVGARAQRRTWIETAHNVVRAAAGRAASDVEEDSWYVDDDDAEPLEKWVRDLIHDRERRQENHVDVSHPDPSRA